MPGRDWLEAPALVAAMRLVQTPVVTDDRPDSTTGAPLDLATAEQISSVLMQLAGPIPSSGKSTPAEAISGGLLAVRFAGDHMVCHYDPATAEPQAWDRALRDHLGDEAAALVRYQPARTFPADLVALFTQIGRRDWHPRAASTSLGATIDWEHEVIEVSIGAVATDEVVTTLIALTGDRAVVTTGVSFSREAGFGRQGETSQA